MYPYQQQIPSQEQLAPGRQISEEERRQLQEIHEIINLLLRKLPIQVR